MPTGAGVNWGAARVCCNMPSNRSRNAITSGFDISLLHCAGYSSTISGNHVRWRLPAGMRLPSREVRELVQRPAGSHTAPQPGERYLLIGMVVLQTVGRAYDPVPATVQDMRVDHRRAHVGMAQQLLDGADVVAVRQQLRRKRMPEGVTADVLGDARSVHCLL